MSTYSSCTCNFCKYVLYFVSIITFVNLFHLIVYTDFIQQVFCHCAVTAGGFGEDDNGMFTDHLLDVLILLRFCNILQLHKN